METVTHPRPPAVLLDRPDGLRQKLVDAGLPIGRPVIVLIGGASKLDAAGATTLEPFVRDGILATARELGATVVDGGTDAGVMALAGQSNRAKRPSVPLVGVAPLGKIKAEGVAGANGTTSLEPNHTLALLAPGNEWGDESPWLIDAAKVLADGQPIVVVVVDGGQVTSIEANKCRAEGWPLVTLAGSGRTADDLARIARRDPESAAAGGGVYVSDLEAGAAALGSQIRSLLETAGVADVEFPALYRAASQASRRGQKQFKSLARLEYGLTLLGLALAILVLVGAGLELKVPLAIAAFFMAAAFLAALFVKLIGHSTGYEEDWLTGRGVSEAVKAHSWRYMTRTTPYAGEDADDRFREELEGLMERVSEIRQAIDSVGPRPRQIHPSMRQVRALDLAGRRDVYAARRIRAQADWYQTKSDAHGKAANRFFWASIVFQLLAALFAVAVFVAGESRWHEVEVGSLFVRIMSLCASSAIALTAWTQLNRNAELARNYGLTFHELTLIGDAAPRVTTEAALEVLVHDSEEAMGRENRAWVARRSERYDSPEFGHAE